MVTEVVCGSGVLMNEVLVSGLLVVFSLLCCGAILFCADGADCCDYYDFCRHDLVVIFVFV